MNPSQFDNISRLFAARRISRRKALAAGGGLAALGLSRAAAQDATPMPSPEAEAASGVHFMFVQTFGAGSLAPKTGEDGVLVLTADHLTGQTIFFSDRPERIVGTVPTERFLGAGSAGGAATPEEGMGFTPAEPPNGALVFDSAAGAEAPGDAIIVELIDPTYDRATGQATYEIKVLADETAVDLTLVSEPVSAADAIRQFEGASLFIDDCPNGTLNCRLPCNNGDSGCNTLIGSTSIGYCYNAGEVCCDPCSYDWTQECAQAFPGCVDDNGNAACNGDVVGGQWSCTSGN